MCSVRPQKVSRLPLQSQALLLWLVASVAVPADSRKGEAGSCLLLCAVQAMCCSVRPTEVSQLPSRSQAWLLWPAFMW